MECDYDHRRSGTEDLQSYAQQDHEELTMAEGFVDRWKKQDQGVYRQLERQTAAERRTVNRSQHYVAKIVESIQLSCAVLIYQGSLDL